jgi:hypothetical protein
MERITLSRAATSETDPAGLRITIRVRTRPLRAALLSAAIALWLAGATAMIATVASGALPRPGRSALENLSLLVFAGIGIGLAGHLAWMLFGRETYMISPLALRVRRSIGPLAVGRTYRFADMQDARIIPRRGTAGLPPWKLMCLETERESIVLRHRERYVRLARDLDKAEGAYLLTAIRLWMQERQP